MARRVRVLGGGPAGSAAALAARTSGAFVELVEKSRFPRHKVCGEFLSPEIVAVVERFGLMAEFRKLKPATIDEVQLCFGNSSRKSKLPQPAYGLSRWNFDLLLHQAAKQNSAPLFGPPTVTVNATGRDGAGAPPKGERLFGFKAHFTGPTNSAVELYFFNGCYVGVNPVEGGKTNVCGLGPEHMLKKFDFQVDELLHSVQPLRERTAPLQRAMDWMFVGPLVFRQRFTQQLMEDTWPVGDSLSFVDPFTGSGLLSALVTGEIAGQYAAQGRSVHEYIAACRRALGRSFAFSSFLRTMAGTRLAERLVGYVPGQWLFRLTRPAA
jgi:menaquinone-9 beta-reductase